MPNEAGDEVTQIGQGLADAKEPLSMMLYGREGSAKTTQALGLSRLGKIVAIDAEGGMKPTALKQHGVKIENIDVWPPRGDTRPITFERIEEEVYIPLRTALEENPDAYVGVVIDSFTELYGKLVSQSAAESQERDRAKGKQRGRFQVNVEDFGTTTAMIRQLLRMFRDLGIHLVITALERRDQDDDGFVQYGPQLGPAAAADAMGMVDVVVWTQEEEIGPDGTVFFTGTTHYHDRHRAKDRFNVLPVRMIEPSADRVLAYVTGGLVKQKDARHQAAAREAQKSAS